jgi:high-affinity iron transporter
MGASLLITLREGFEISLVLAILATYLVRTGRRSALRQVWTGTAIAAGLCIAIGIVVNALVGGLHGKSEQAVEGGIALVACGVLTWMIFWMRKNARSLGGELRAKLDLATSAKAIVFIAFVAVVREGLETVLFLLSAKAEGSSASGTDVVIGGLIGLAIAAVLGWATYLGGVKINMRIFFNVTGVLLILFAAGLFGKAFHEFRELFGFESGWLIDPAWTVASGPFADGNFYDFMKGFFGWSSDAERIRVIAYFAYLVPILATYLRNDRNAAPASTSGAAKAGADTTARTAVPSAH